MDKDILLKKHQKELKSIKNKMSSSNLIWFNSLPEKIQYDFLFEWKSYKYYNSKDKIVIKYTRRISRVNGVIKRVYIPIKLYPPKLKHFIKLSRKKYKYKSNISKIRDVAIDMLLKNK